MCQRPEQLLHDNTKLSTLSLWYFELVVLDGRVSRLGARCYYLVTVMFSNDQLLLKTARLGLEDLQRDYVKTRIFFSALPGALFHQHDDVDI